MTANLRHAAGSLLVVGLGGTELTGLERAWLRVVRPAGIILFRRNISESHQTRALLTEAAGLCAAHPLRCVDVEGGTVDRLRDALEPMPSAQAVAWAAASAGKHRLIKEHGELVGRAVKAFGFNTTLAPVLDLDLPISAKVMGTRTAASTPDGVVQYARNFLAGLHAQGVVGCGKHFPGLGGGTLDSHLETPLISRYWAELWENDLAPYRELRSELLMVMVNHAVYPESKDKRHPASISRYWITSVLRRRIGYKGLIFSDDLEMGGILRFVEIEEAAIETLRAGLNLMEICHSPELILRAYEALIAEAERSIAFRTLLLERADQTAKMRRKLFVHRPPAALTERQYASLRKRIRRFGETVRNSQPDRMQPA